MAVAMSGSHRWPRRMQTVLRSLGLIYAPFEADRAQLRRLRVAALVEGATLLALVCVAVPLKHLAHLPAAVSVMGPVHGATFLLYVWMALNTVSGEHWRRVEILRVLLAAVLPFGAFCNAGFMKRKEASLLL